MMKILPIILELKEKDIYLWVEENNIAFSFNQDSGFPDHLKQLVIDNKTRIIELLTINDINSEAIARSILYYKLNDIDKDVLLSDIQKGIYLQTKLDRVANTYNISILLQFNGFIKADILEQAVRMVLIKHNILRLTVSNNYSYKLLPIENIRIERSSIRLNFLEEYVQQQLNHKFMLEGGPLIKPDIVHIIDNDTYILNLTHHHIISDMSSVNILIADTLGTYSDLLNGKTIFSYAATGTGHELDYFDFKIFQSNQLETHEYKIALKELANKLSTCHPVQLRNIDNKKFDNLGTGFKFNIGNEVYNNIQKISLENNVSVYSILITCLYYIISIYNESKNNFAIGITISNRPYEFANAVGPFISTLPLVIDFDSNVSLLTNIERCHAEVLYLNQYGFINLNRLAEQISNTSHTISNLMQIMFTMHNFMAISVNDLKHIVDFDAMLIEEQVERFGISIIAKSESNKIEFNVSYARSIYLENDIKTIFNSYQHLLNSFSKMMLQAKLSSSFTELDSFFSTIQSLESNPEIIDLLYKQRAKNYWLGLIGDLPLGIQFPHRFEFDKQQRDSQVNNLLYFEIEEKISNQIRKYAQENKTTLFIVFAAIYGVVLSRYANQDKILLSCLMAIPELDENGMIEHKINIIPLKFILRQDITFDALICELIKQSIEAKKYSRYQLKDIIQDQHRNRNEVSNPFNIKFTSFDCESLKPYFSSDIDGTSSIDELILSYHDMSQGTIKLKLDIVKQLFDQEILNAFISSFKSLLTQVIEQPKLLLSNYSALDLDAYKRVVYDWNTTENDFSSNRNLLTLFEEQTILTPNNIAVIDCGQRDKEYTYTMLAKSSTGLAKFLMLKNKNYTNKLVAVLSEKGFNQVVAILAIIKAGSGYVPLHVEWPNGRFIEILETSSIKQILISKQEYIQKKLSDQLPIDYEFLIIEDILKETEDNLRNDSELGNTILPEIMGESIAYVIFTSGSTGIPKGVAISHSGLYNTVIAVNDKYQVIHTDKILALSELSFDLSVYDIFGMLVSGGTIVFPVQSKSKNPIHWVELINQYQITLWNSVPQLAQLLVNELSLNKLSDTSLRLFLLSGDWIPVTLAEQLIKNCSQMCQVVSLGGATECSIWSVWYPIKNISDSWRSIPYGRAMPHQMIYILDYSLNLCPIGVIGEIYIGGSGVALGYYNDASKTHTSFIQHPQLNRLYKTGDLGCWNANGYIEYIGRNDFQVKIQGFRVELGEIETLICNYPGITESVVLAKDQYDSLGNLTSNKYLAAYYTKNFNVDEDDTKHFIHNWELIYQANYSNINTSDEFGINPSILGWKSSYTQEEIAEYEMAEWVESTINRIKQLKPNVILEIGSGSGLILFNLLGEFKHYYATDFSTNAINYINQQMKHHNCSNKIDTFVCSADSVPTHMLSHAYDTIVMNSVIQYFPSLEYLELVINACIRDLGNSYGQIFIGDVRDYRLLQCFHYSVQYYNHTQVTLDEVNYFSGRDKELLVSPQYFVQLGKQNKQITYIEILPRIGSADNEMNNYRYDVILHLNKLKDNITNIFSDKFIKVDNLVDYLAAHSTEDILYVKYLNKRIIADFSRYSLIVNNIITITSPVLAINEITELVNTRSYEVQFFLDAENELFFNLIIYNKDKFNNCFSINYHPDSNIISEKLSNNPIIATKLLEANDVDALKKYLSNVLPQYMMPVEYTLLEKFPLTSIGKLDRSSLAKLSFSVNLDKYTPPRNELESSLCKLYAEVLGLSYEQVGIDSNFFQLGGNSIIATNLANKLNNEVFHHVNRNVNVSDIFQYNIIRELLIHIENKDDHDEIIIPKLMD